MNATFFSIGDRVAFHPNVNKDPYLGNCVICGRKVSANASLVRFNFNGEVDPNATDFDGFKFAVGNECVKKFDPTTLEK